MRKIRGFILVLSLLANTAVYGISSFIEISAGGGWSSLGYSLTNETQQGLTMRQNGSYGLNAHIGYGLQFNKYIGLGVGVDLARYGADARLKGTAEWMGVTDTEGERYDHIVSVHTWNDRQSVYMIEIPLSVYLRFPVSETVRVYGQIGAKVCLPVMSSASYKGTISHSGVYEPWMLTLSNMPNHGFYTANMQDSYALRTHLTVAGFVKIGVEAPVDKLNNIWLYGTICGSVHFMPAVTPDTGNNIIGWRNDTYDQTMYQAHSFMSDYSPILSTNLIKREAKPFALGAEIGIRFRIPHFKRYGCNCERE